jgi:hypothetical protein
VPGPTGATGPAGATGATGPTGATGATGDDGIVAQTTAPVNTDILWLDTDEPASSAGLLPTGGTTGQVLSKINSTDYNTQWIAPPSGTPRAYEPPAYVSTRYYSTLYNSINSGNQTTNTTRFIPIYIWENATFDLISVACGGTYSGTMTVRLGIFNNGSNNLPSTVVLDAGTVSRTGTGTATVDLAINQTLTKGWYWLAANWITAATTNNFIALLPSNSLTSQFIGSPAIGQSPWAFETYDATSGFSTTTAADLSAATVPTIHLRKS